VIGRAITGRFVGHMSEIGFYCGRRRTWHEHAGGRAIRSVLQAQ
jgi:predicted NBD/HSP70 family sugar kinase